MHQFQRIVLILFAVLLLGVVLANAAEHDEQVQPAQRFEYLVYSPAELLELRKETHPNAGGESAMLAQLNAFGKQGWELTEVAAGHLYLKRVLR